MSHSIRRIKAQKKENIIEYAPSFQWNRRAYMTSSEENEKPATDWIDVDKFPSDSACTILRCVNICKVIYREAGTYYAQCMGHDCFCFKKDSPFPPELRNFMRKYTFFGIPQIYN